MSNSISTQNTVQQNWGIAAANGEVSDSEIDQIIEAMQKSGGGIGDKELDQVLEISARFRRLESTALALVLLDS